jgi:hypothetical protein
MNRVLRRPGFHRAMHAHARRAIVARGRPWRAANPGLTREARQPRRVVDGCPLRAGRRLARRRSRCIAASPKPAERQLNAARIALGEHGPLWRADGADLDRHRVRNSPYAQWFADREAIKIRVMTRSA